MIRPLVAVVLACCFGGCRKYDDGWVVGELTKFKGVGGKMPDADSIATVKEVYAKFKEAGDQAGPALVAVVNDPKQEKLHAEAAFFMLNTNAPEADKIGLQMLESTHLPDLALIIAGLSAKPRPSLIGDIVSDVHKGRISVSQTTRIFEAWHDKRTLPFLREELSKCSPDIDDRLTAASLIDAMVAIGDPETVPDIRRFANAKDFRTQQSAISGLKLLHADFDAKPLLARARALLASNDSIEQLEGANALLDFNDPSAEQIFLKFAKSTDPVLKEGAAEALSEFTSSESEAALEALARDPDAYLQEDAKASLRHRRGTR